MAQSFVEIIAFGLSLNQRKAFLTAFIFLLKKRETVQKINDSKQTNRKKERSA